MDRVVRAAHDFLIDRDQILHGRHLRRQDDPVLGHAELLGAGRRQQRRLHHRLAGHRAGIARIGRGRVLVHQLGEQLLVERAPIGADTHRLVVLVGDLDDVGELGVALVLEADIAGIDAVLVERLGAGRILGEQLVADIVEVADQGRGDAQLAQAVADVRHGGGGFLAVDGDAHHLGAGAGERGDLGDGALDVGGVGVGHRLHDDRRAAADGDVADHDLRGVVPRCGTGDVVLRQNLGLVHGVSNIRFR
ncbi:hypothetical protein ACVWW1_006136 [Bradyrhizobium sp. JR3.5]